MGIQLHRLIKAFLLITVIAASASCSREAATINALSITATGGGGTVGTDHPQVYAVFPGRLTSHSGSPGVMTGITPGDTDNDITVVFTRVMDSAYVNSAIHVYVGATGSTSAVFTVNTSNSQSYTINITGGLAASTTYRVVIDDTAYLSGDPTLNLDFSNLEALYAGSLTEVTEATPSVNDVEFQLTTNATGTVSDTTVPYLAGSNPLDTATDVPISLSGSNGRIEFTFSEAVNPTTVTGTSVTLTGASAGGVSGTVGRIDETNMNFFFLPDAELDYDDIYTLTVSVGSAIEDYAGNPMVQDTISFSTPLYSSVPASINTGSVYIEYDPGNPTEVTIYWTTDIKSVSHVEIDNAETFAAAEDSYHDTALVYNHSYTFSPLDRNQVYSFSISTNSDPGTLTGGPFNQTLSFNAVIRTTPDASCNYQLAVNGSDETGLELYQLDVDRSFLIWKRGTGLYAQYMDSSSGTADTWDKWTASGVSLFTADGLIGIISDGTTTGAIVSGVNSGDVYASRIYDSTGITYTWGSSGLQVYDGSAANARMALTGSGYVSSVTSGTAETSFIYDTGVTFTALTDFEDGDHLINEDENLHATLLTSGEYDNLILLSSDVITDINRNYRIGNNDVQVSDTIDTSSTGITVHTDHDYFTNQNIITNGNGGYTYLTSDVSYNFILTCYDYDLAFSLSFSTSNTATTYEYIAGSSNTADTNALYDSSEDFSGTGLNIAADDILVNTATGEFDTVNGVYAGNNSLLVLDTTTRFLFDTAQAYSIFRLPVPGDFVTCGRSTGFGTLTVTDTGRQFITTDGVAVNDMIYRVDTNTYAKITARTETTLTLDRQIFTAANQNFIIYHWSGVTFAWDESDNINGRTVSLVDGSLVYPSATVTDSFVITDIAAAVRNPYIISSIGGDAIVVYERDSGSGTWSINAKMIRSDGAFVWADPADQSTDAGIVVSAAFTPAGAYLIKDVISDSNGGCWVLYETDVPSVRVAHISSSGTVTVYSMATAANASIASVSATQVVVVYEYGTAPSIIYARRFANTPAAGTAIQVSPGTVTYSQLNPRVCGDGSGGAIISWLDMRYFPSVYYSIYAQHLDSSLTQTYSADKFVGTPVLDDQTVSPYLIDHSILRWNDGGGLYEGIHFWSDERGGNDDIYYQNMTN